jgi:hypothetical protein
VIADVGDGREERFPLAALRTRDRLAPRLFEGEDVRPHPPGPGFQDRVAARGHDGFEELDPLARPDDRRLDLDFRDRNGPQDLDRDADDAGVFARRKPLESPPEEPGGRASVLVRLVPRASRRSRREIDAAAGLEERWVLRGILPSG